MPDPANELIDYICKQILRCPDIELTADTPLVSSGLIDSFSLVDVLSKLEEVTALRIPASKVQPKDMDTVSLMLTTAQRLGKPRK
ncbi:MAG TPA: acyl carrier protein [Candidatus Binatus sp.]|jgi:acyl carrier protein|nr:acyl carrier protein [Candidatus Binatus sp.]